MDFEKITNQESGEGDSNLTPEEAQRLVEAAEADHGGEVKIDSEGIRNILEELGLKSTEEDEEHPLDHAA